MKANTMNRTIHKIFLALAALTIFTSMDCKDDPPPKHDDKPPLGKRNYTWSADTIAYPGNFQTLMSDIWGSSANDVYVVGHSDGSSAATMFRYDGVKWNTTKFHTREGGPITGPIDLRGVYSFSKNNVWAVGERDFEYPAGSGQYIDSSIIIHYNGVGWHEHKVEGGRGLLTVWGTDSNNVWVGGANGTLYHKIGNQFQKINFPSNFSVATITGLNSDSIFIRSYLQGQGTDFYVVLDKYINDQFVRIDSTHPFPSTPHFGTAYIHLLKPDKFYTSGSGGVYQKTDSGWNNVLNTGTESITGIRGSATNNIFAVGRGKVYHFNGEDWYKYEQFSDQAINWVRAWSDGNEVFIIGQTSSGIDRTVVLHGK